MPQVSAPPGPHTKAEPSPPPNSPIRSIDFADFTYPAKPIYSKGERTFRLQKGKYDGRYRGVFDIPFPVSLAYLTYGDVTSDEAEEAMVILFENVKGTAIPYYVYVYTLEGGSQNYYGHSRLGIVAMADYDKCMPRTANLWLSFMA
jgi:hypothetical protein